MKFLCQLHCFMAVLALTVGCAGGVAAPEDRPACTKVAGTATLDGAPIEGATVTLHPNQKGYGAFGKTDSNGKFVLTTFQQNDGAVPGEYKISVTKLAPGSSAAVSMEDPAYNPEAKEEPPKHLLPEKYASFLESGLSTTVGKEPITDLKVELKK